MDSNKRVKKPQAVRSKKRSASSASIAKPKRAAKLLTSFEEHLEHEYGTRGTPAREKYEAEFEAFKIGFLIQEARKRQHLTQDELARRVGTTKNYISRIENGASDIRLATLMRIVRNGLNGDITLTF